MNFYQVEFSRLVKNSGARRTDLLKKGLRTAARRKALTVCAGMLSLVSAGAIATDLTNLLGHKAFEVFALVVALASGFLSLMLVTYFTDTESGAMLTASSKYLSLREAANRALIDTFSGTDQHQLLVEYQTQYAKLDEDYSKYLSPEVATHTVIDPYSGVSTGGSNE